MCKYFIFTTFATLRRLARHFKWETGISCYIEPFFCILKPEFTRNQHRFRANALHLELSRSINHRALHGLMIHLIRKQATINPKLGKIYLFLFSQNISRIIILPIPTGLQPFPLLLANFTPRRGHDNSSSILGSRQASHNQEKKI